MLLARQRLVIALATVLLGAALTPAWSQAQQPVLPILQALPVPSSVRVPPNGVVWPYLPTTNQDVATAPLVAVVTNRSDQTATITEDGASLTIAVPPGYIPLPDLPCTAQADPTVASCPLTSSQFVSFDAADATHPQSLPIATTVPVRQSLALSAVASDGSGAVIAVGIALAGNADGTEAPSLAIGWDGATLILSAPTGYRILDGPTTTLAAQGCTPVDDVPTAVSCVAPGSAPRLFTVATESLDLRGQHPPGTPPDVGAMLISPVAGGVYTVGQPVTFVARGDPGVVYLYFWDFGDATSTDGPVAQHTYAAPGLYTVQLTVVADLGGGLGLAVSTTTVTVTVAPTAAPSRTE